MAHSSFSRNVLWTLALFPLLLCAAGLAYCFKPAPGFSLAKIRFSAAISCEWDAPPPSAAQKELLSQPFHYLGNGAQCFVFASADGHHVLKFFKMKHLTPKPWNRARRLARLRQTFGSCQLAFDRLREETGLIYLHLSRTQGQLPQTVLFDKEGKRHLVELDAVPFLVQRRAEALYPYLIRLHAAGDEEGAERAIRSVLRLVERRCSQGLADTDLGVRNNYGFVNGAAIQIDVGGLVPMDALDSAQEMDRIHQKLRAGLEGG
jgi:hypothetical protein